MDYTDIFNVYTTYQGVPFYLLSKSVTFPQDESLEIYDKVYADEDIAWTVASWKLYGSIDYWWVLSALNPTMQFYAKRGEIIKIIKPSELDKVLKYIE